MELFWQILAAASIPSTVLGLIVWQLQRKLIKMEIAREAKANAESEYYLLSMKNDNVIIQLTKATAEAVRDGKCNGNVTAALACVEDAEKEQAEFIRKLAVRILQRNSA